MLLSEFLAKYEDVDRAIGQALANVAALAATYERTGKVVVEIKVAASGSKSAVTVGHKVTEPRPDPELGVFYRGPGGELTKEDPSPHQFFNGRTGEITPAANPESDHL